jgi:hypothetical protein
MYLKSFFNKSLILISFFYNLGQSKIEKNTGLEDFST